jgi:hypothetical protein
VKSRHQTDNKIGIQFLQIRIVGRRKVEVRGAANCNILTKGNKDLVLWCSDGSIVNIHCWQKNSQSWNVSLISTGKKTGTKSSRSTFLCSGGTGVGLTLFNKDGFYWSKYDSSQCKETLY